MPMELFNSTKLIFLSLNNSIPINITIFFNFFVNKTICWSYHSVSWWLWNIIKQTKSLTKQYKTL